MNINKRSTSIKFSQIELFKVQIESHSPATIANLIQQASSCATLSGAFLLGPGLNSEAGLTRLFASLMHILSANEG
jgi:hypothetical protein